jgi:hypothetical protein
MTTAGARQQPNTIPAALLSKQPVPHYAKNKQPNAWYLKKGMTIKQSP